MINYLTIGFLFTLGVIISDYDKFPHVKSWEWLVYLISGMFLYPVYIGFMLMEINRKK